MIEILYAVALYVIVFGIDYLFYVKQKIRYEYVSRRTYFLFIAGQITAVWLFYDVFKQFVAQFPTELLFVSVLAGLLILFTYAMTRDKVYVCNLGSRSFRCLTPWYVVVKGAEIIFQQLIYLVIALSLVSLMGINLGTYTVYVFILLVAHVIVIVGCTRTIAKRLTFGLFAISIPIFYIFTAQGILWPAVYLHGIMYVFYWLLFADFDVQPLGTPKGKDKIYIRG